MAPGTQVAKAQIKDGRLIIPPTAQGEPQPVEIGQPPDKATQNKSLIDILKEKNSPPPAGNAESKE